MNNSEKVNNHCLRWLRAQWKLNEDYVELATEMFGKYSAETIEGGTKAAIAKSGKFKPTLAELAEAIQKFGYGDEKSVPNTKLEPGRNPALGDAAMRTDLGRLGLEEGWASSLWMDAACGKPLKTAYGYRLARAKALEELKTVHAMTNPALKQALLGVWNAMEQRDGDLREKFIHGEI